MSVDIKFTRQGFENDSTCVLKAEPGKPDFKRHSPSILYVNGPANEILVLVTDAQKPKLNDHAEYKAVLDI